MARTKATASADERLRSNGPPTTVRRPATEREDRLQLSRALAEPDRAEVTPDVVRALQATHGNRFANQMIARARGDGAHGVASLQRQRFGPRRPDDRGRRDATRSAQVRASASEARATSRFIEAKTRKDFDAMQKAAARVTRPLTMDDTQGAATNVPQAQLGILSQLADVVQLRDAFIERRERRRQEITHRLYRQRVERGGSLVPDFVEAMLRSDAGARFEYLDSTWERIHRECPKDATSAEIERRLPGEHITLPGDPGNHALDRDELDYIFVCILLRRVLEAEDARRRIEKAAGSTRPARR